VLGESDDSQVGSAADLLDRSASPSWDGLGEELLENTAATRDWSTSTQHDVPLVNEVDVLSVVLEGRESAANTTMSHHDNSNAAAAAEAIEQRQDEAEELLICIEMHVLSVAGLTHTPWTAMQLGEKMEDLTAKLSKCHVFLRRRDRDNHAEDLGPRIEQTLAKMKDLYEKLAELKLEGGDLREPTPDARASPAPPPIDPELLDSARQASAAATDSMKEAIAEATRFLELQPKDDDQIFRFAEMFRVMELQMEAACSQGVAAAARTLTCKLYGEEQHLQLLINKLKQTRVAGQAALMKWRTEAGVFAEKLGRGNRALLKPPSFTGKPRTTTIYEFIKDWAVYKLDANLSIHEALKELKSSVREADKDATDDMATEAAIFAHLTDKFGNIFALIRGREQEIAAWKSCKGSYEFRRDWFIHAKARLQNIVDLCEEHDAMDHLLDSNVHKTFQAKLDDDAEEKLMDIFETFMGRTKHTPKKYIYPCLLQLCDQIIQKMTMRVNMKANPDTAGRPDGQPKANSGNGGAGSSGNGGGSGWKGRNRSGAHAVGNQDDGTASGGVRKGGDGGTQPSNVSNNPKKCQFCPEFHPFLFYCQVFINSKVKDRFDMVVKQRSCTRCLTMGKILEGKKDTWWSDHDSYCKNQFVCEVDNCKNLPREKQRHLVICSSHFKQNRKRIAQGNFPQPIEIFPRSILSVRWRAPACRRTSPS